MEQEERDLLARALDMTEIELRATLITIIRDTFGENQKEEIKNIVRTSIDAAYNPIRRTGIKL